MATTGKAYIRTYWLLTMTVLALIIWLTLFYVPSPGMEMPSWQHADKVVHAVMFGILFIAMAIDWFFTTRRRSVPKLSAAVYFQIFAWSSLCGAIIELVQPLTHRTCDLFDFLADVAGIILAWLISPIILSLLKQKGVNGCHGH